MWKNIIDGLPLEDGNVIIFAPSADGNKPLIAMAWYNPNGFGWSLLPKYWIDGITHWMPLPAPPKSDNAEAVKQPLTGNKSEPSDITPNCNTCDCLLSCGISDKVKYCSNYTPA